MVKSGITVPKEYRSELRNDSSPEYKIACIRDYVKAHPDEIINGAKWLELIGSNYPTYIKRLKDQGRLVRMSVKDGKQGVRYRWKWIDKDYRADAKPSEVVVHNLGYQDYPLGNENALRLLAQEIDTYVDDNIEVLKAEEVHGIFKFRKYMKTRHQQVRKHNEAALEKHNQEA